MTAQTQLLPKTKILIVDDNRENIIALSQLIAADDVEIISTENPEHALSLIVDHDFALALLDVQMPVITGFELAYLIRGVKRSKHLPVIFVTAHQIDYSFVFEGYETGAVDLLFKPLDAHVVRSKVRVFVQLDRQSKLLRQQMLDLERMRFEADAANFAKSRFLANVSHEIRTPLAAVMGFADVMMHNNLTNAEKEECFSAIRRNGILLTRLIDDILDLSKIEAQKLEFDTSIVSLNEIIRDVESGLSLRAVEKGITLCFHVPENIGHGYVSDPVRIKQVLLNVVGNAIKFTSQGNVDVDVQINESSKQPGADLIAIRVKDTGMGLTREQAAKLFHPFTQADPSTRRNFGGTGLGLVISKQIATVLGGDVELESSLPGRGSIFVITLVLKRATQTESNASNSLIQFAKIETGGKSLKGREILVVDDVADNRLLVQRYLAASGVRVKTAESGSDAIKSVALHAPDLILMDIQMPGMDGYQTTEAIRNLGFRRPIIALTAHAMRDERDRCLAAGCNTVLTKPIARKDLIQALGSYLNPI